MVDLPEPVSAAITRARDAGFALACEPEVGRLLAALAAAVPERGRILELGTGVGVGLTWIVWGLGHRTDVEVISVESDPQILGVAAAAGWPDYVRLELGDGAEQVRRLGAFDLLFPDAPGGKLTGLDDSVAALKAGGILVVDDMDPAQHDDPELVRLLAGVREHLLHDPELIAVELHASSGIIVATKRRA